jgi:hypothetical protein
MRAKAFRWLPNIRTSGILPRLLGTSTWHIAAGRRSYESYGSNRRRHFAAKAFRCSPEHRTGCQTSMQPMLTLSLTSTLTIAT